MYANWQTELEAFETECDRIRQARKASFPVKMLSLAPLATVPFIGKMPLGRQFLAGTGILIGAVSLLSEMDKQRSSYGGNLRLDLNPNCDWDNLAGAFETRSPRWRAIAYLYSQLDPIHLKDRLSHLSDEEGTKVLNRCVKQVQKGLGTIAQLNPGRQAYLDEVLTITSEWKHDVSGILDRALFNAGKLDEEDLEPEDLADVEYFDNEGDEEAIAPDLQPALYGAEELIPQAPSISAGWNRQQWALWHKLMDECPDFRFLMLANTVVISGPQQTGKSSLASAIAYCRRFLLGWESVAASPHPDGKIIFDGQVIGTGGDFEAIQEFYTAMVEGFKMGDVTRSLIVDELTQYAGDWKELGQSLVRTAISEATKHGWKAILINHATTVSAGFAGIKGVKELIESSAVRVLRSYAYAPDGSVGRNPVVGVSLPGLGDRTIIIPAWLHLPELKRAFPIELPAGEVVEHRPVDPFPVRDQASEQPRQQPTGRVGFRFDDNIPTALPVALPVDEVSFEELFGEFSDEKPLTLPAQKLLTWLEEKSINSNEFTVRDLVISKAVGRNFSHTSDAVRSLLGELAASGKVWWVNDETVCFIS